MSQPTRRTVLTATAAAALSPPIALGRSRPDRPNILLIFPDQLRAQALSMYGESNIQTPVFDALLRDSVQFERTYAANPVCAPSRASLLTGLYPTEHQVTENGDRLPNGTPTLATQLQGAGYRTGYIGKWHLDGNTKPGFVPLSRRHGFGWWAAYNSGHRYRHATYFRDDPEPIHPTPIDRFEPEMQVDLAFEFFDQPKPSPKPWFLMMSFGPPHPPGSTPIQDWGVDIPRKWLAAIDPNDITFNPNVPKGVQEPYGNKKGNKASPGARHHLHGYYAAVLALQHAIERLLGGLKERGLDNDTLVVLASDHGEMGGAHGQFKKGMPYEEALRVPLCFRWPGTLKPRSIRAPTSLVDVAPTLASIAGAPFARHQGYDLRETLYTGEAVRKGGVLALGRVGRSDEWAALRGPRYLYAEFGKQRPKTTWLFDNQSDPFQLHNLAGQPDSQATQRRLARELKRHQRANKRGGVV